jgi:hypothetical protein
MNNLTMETKWNDYHGDVLYLLNKLAGTFTVILEGDGSNLTDEDVAAGYVDYWTYDMYDSNKGTMIDGGMNMVEEVIKETNPTIGEIIELHGWSPEEFTIMTPGMGYELNELFERIMEIQLQIRGGVAAALKGFE